MRLGRFGFLELHVFWHHSVRERWHGPPPAAATDGVSTNVVLMGRVRDFLRERHVSIESGKNQWQTVAELVASGEALLVPGEGQFYWRHAICRKHPSSVLMLLRRIRTQPSALRHLRDFVRKVSTHPNLAALSDEEILAQIARWTSSGQVLLGYRRPIGMGGAAPAEEEAAKPTVAAKATRKPRATKTWIEIQLVDSADKPVPGEKYRVKLTDGRESEGTLDSDGRARFNQIDPGTCQVCFPEIDANEWKAA